MGQSMLLIVVLAACGCRPFSSSVLALLWGRLVCFLKQWKQRVLEPQRRVVVGER